MSAEKREDEKARTSHVGLRAKCNYWMQYETAAQDTTFGQDLDIINKKIGHLDIIHRMESLDLWQ